MEEYQKEISMQTLQRRIMEFLDDTENISDEYLLECIDKVLVEDGRRNGWSFKKRQSLRKELYHSLRGLDVIQELLDDPSVTEIMVNGYQNIFIEQNGYIRRCEKSFTSEEKLNDLIQKMVSAANRVVNETTPVVDARLEDGSRIHVVLPPVSLVGPVLTIRKFPEHFNIEQLVKLGSLTEECAEFLKELVKARYNIFISGGTGAGKTTFLNALSEFIPMTERIITIEDSAELKLKIPNLVCMEARNQNMEGKNEIRIRDLIRAALRMRPDRIIVGEVRSEEAIDMLQAMSTGHDGSICTGHANSSADMLLRLQVMIMLGKKDVPIDAVKAQIGSAIDILIHLERFSDGSRKVVSVEEVLGYQSGEICVQSLFEYDRNKKCICRSGNELERKQKLWKMYHAAPQETIFDKG